VLAQFQAAYPDEVRIVYRHFPLLSIHDKAALATQAAEAAGKQDQFWEMHDLLFEKQAEWSELSVEDFEAWLVERATELGLDADQFQADMIDPATAAIAQKGWDDGMAANLRGTPSLLLNGIPYDGQYDPSSLQAILQMMKLEAIQFTECPPMTIDQAKQYTATLETEKGDIVIDLLDDTAPLAVNSFIFLANNGWFDGVTFHRVIPGFVAQAGDPTGTGYGGPGYAFVNEVSTDLKFDKEGVVGMANSGADANGSQFFITLAPAPNLDGGYTIFGQVIAGMDVVNSLTPRNPQENANLPPGDKILSVKIEEK
jgi:cyclophilin family peptidyl-prolyl cis-trans isomerase